MGEVFDIHRYTHVVVLCMEKERIAFDCYSTITKETDNYGTSKSKDTCIIYDKRKKNVESWGDTYFKRESDNIDIFRYTLHRIFKKGKGKSNQTVRIDSFREELYKIFKKDKDKWDQEDLFVLKAVSDFIRLLVEDLAKTARGPEGTDKLHYMFAVPSEWEEEIRETLLRPIFVQSSLISKDDHKDRLLFCSDIDSIFYGLMHEKAFDFEKRKKTILCRLCPISGTEVLIKWDLISTVNSMFDLPGSLLYPNIERSNSLFLTTNTFTDGIRDFIKDKLPLSIQEEVIQTIMNISLSIGELADERTYSNKILIKDTSKWELDKHQKDFVESISIFDICSQVCRNLTNNIDYLLLNDIIKEYNILTRTDWLSFGGSPYSKVLNWSGYLVTYNRTHSRNKNIVYTSASHESTVNSSNIIKGACLYVRDVINNSDIHSKPRILPVKNSITPSVFRNSKPDAIMNIDISMESTILSYSILDESGFVKEFWSHSDFLIDKSLRSLGSFFDFSETTTLNVNFSFIEFSEEYLLGDISFFYDDKNNALFQLNVEKIEAMLYKDSLTEDLLISTQCQIYIKAFLLLYMTYLKHIISSKLSNSIDPNMETKIGYNITIEKILLNRLFGTKEGLQDVIYASGLIQKDDHFKKLRIITQGERIIHLVRQSLALPFPLRAFFVLTQIHKNYIQLTLKQVVTESRSGKEDQEAVIIDDRIIHIPNVYTSLCSNMWNNIVEDTSLIQLCDKHQEYSDSSFLEILSLKNRAEFTKNLKKYISKENFDNSSSQPVNDKIIIQLNESCECKVNLTIRDVIDISFLPVLQEIASLVSSSFINKELFANFRNIQYLFQLIHFEYNAQLHDVIIKMLKETIEDVMIEQGVDVSHYIVQKSLNQLLQPVLYQQPISYKEFQVGTLHTVYGDTFGFCLDQRDPGVKLFYKRNTTDTKPILVNFGAVFPLFKKGEIINDFTTSLTFYLNPQGRPKLGKPRFHISYFKLKMQGDFNSDGIACYDDIQESIFGSFFENLPEEFVIGQDVPIVIFIYYEAHLGSLTIRSKLVGQDINISKPLRLATPMHLSRF